MSLFRRLFRVPVTTRSRPTGAILRTVDATGTAEVLHTLHVPRGACPVSGNPLSGTITVSYHPIFCSLEAVSLHDALLWACSRAPTAPRSVESLATWMAGEAARAVGVPVVVDLDLIIRPGHQRLRVVAKC